jgi:hypothetical protein
MASSVSHNNGVQSQYEGIIFVVDLGQSTIALSKPPNGIIFRLDRCHSITIQRSLQLRGFLLISGFGFLLNHRILSEAAVQ